MKEKSHTIHKFAQQISAFKAGDHTLLKELLHPKNDGLNLPFSMASAKIEAGEKSLPHRLIGSETYYFTRGQGFIYVDDEQFEVVEGHLVHVPAGALQYVVNTGETDLEFLCIVAPAWSEEGEEVF